MATMAPKTRTLTIKVPADASFAEVGRAAAKAAQRETLLEALKANGWNLTATAEALGMGSLPSSVIRSIKTLGLEEEYEKARASGKISPGNRRPA